jgi:hypothetical protein
MERTAEVVAASGDQGLQHFLSNSNLYEHEVLDRVTGRADAVLGRTADSALLIGAGRGIGASGSGTAGKRGPGN